MTFEDIEKCIKAQQFDFDITLIDKPYFCIIRVNKENKLKEIRYFIDTILVLWNMQTDVCELEVLKELH